MSNTESVTVGGKILDNIALSMYKEAKVIFREYIQNATDAIDDAVKDGVLAEGDGEINITIDKDARRITIEDNGIGISSLDFKSTLLGIGNSDKKLANNRGYRGIGRFCGLGYCKTLIFTSTRKGGTKLSTMTFDAEKLRIMTESDKKYTAEIILNATVTFSETTTDADEHFFKVELIDVTNDELLKVTLEKDEDPSKIETVRDYLSFVAPVEYRNTFSHREKIYKYAAELGVKITEYKIFINGEPLAKNYKDNFTTKNGEDKIFDVAFKTFRDDENNLIAWSWIGLSQFKGVIQKTKANPNHMRCIRLRSGNIQIGDENVFQSRKLFTEDRGTTYFVGEVHAVDTKLKPNSQRDYFANNDTLKLFEEKLKKYFAELHDLYHYASDSRSAFKAKIQPEVFMLKIESHTPAYQATHRAEHDAALDNLLKKATEAETFIDKARQDFNNNPAAIAAQVFKEIEADAPTLEDTNIFYPPPRVAIATLVSRN
ncbi:MAG: ATP-binding protein [Quinella sp. 3Q1]|nr:ATP-binding protein [Quinella sp. 3Q1]